MIDVPGVERAGLVVYPTEQAALTPTFTSLELGKQVSAVYTSHTLIPQLRDYDVAVRQYISNHSGPTTIEINGHRVSAAPLLMQPAGIELNSVLVLRHRRR